MGYLVFILRAVSPVSLRGHFMIMLSCKQITKWWQRPVQLFSPHTPNKHRTTPADFSHKMLDNHSFWNRFQRPPPAYLIVRQMLTFLLPFTALFSVESDRNALPSSCRLTQLSLWTQLDCLQQRWTQLHLWWLIQGNSNWGPRSVRRCVEERLCSFLLTLNMIVPEFWFY